MKKTSIEGELREEVQKQLDEISSQRKAVYAINAYVYEIEGRMWKQIKKEFPDISENTTITSVDDTIVLTDRLAD